MNKTNFDLIERSWRDGFGGRSSEDTGKGLVFRDVDVERIEDFLNAFQAHSDFADRKSDIVAYLRALSDQYRLGDVLLISPRGVDGRLHRLNDQLLAVSRREGARWQLNKDRVASRGDEKLGLAEDQKAAAKAMAASGDNPVEASDTHYREVRKKPLLMIHSLDPHGDDKVKGPVAAFGVSFPPGHYDT